MEEERFFLMIRQPSLWHLFYVIVDSGEHLAAQLFRKRGLHVRFLKQYTSRDSECPYQLLLCRVPKRERERFEVAMEEFVNKMLLCGYPSYRQDCAEIWKELIASSGEPERFGCAT